MLEGLKNKLKNKYGTLSELGQCLADKEYIHNKLGEASIDINERNEEKLKEANRNELIRRMRALSTEEWEIVLSEAPIEMCHERIGRELREAKEFKKSIGVAVNSIEPEEV